MMSTPRCDGTPAVTSPADAPGRVRRVTTIPLDELDGFEHRMVDVGDVRLHAVLGGRAGRPAVVLLAGFPETWHAWHRAMPVLARHHRVVALDLPGQGHSDRPATGYDTEAVAARLRRLLGELGLDRYWLVAHDAGAWVAVAHALDHDGPELLGLALFDAAIPGVSMPEQIPTDPAIAAKLGHLAFHLVPDLPELLIRGREREYAEWFLTHKVAPSSRIDPAAIDRYGALLAADGGLDAILAYYRSAATSAAQNRRRAGLRHITAPVLAVSSDQGSVPDMAAALRSIADDVEGAVVTDSGHFVLDEQPEQVLRLVEGFLARTAPLRTFA